MNIIQSKKINIAVIMPVLTLSVACGLFCMFSVVHEGLELLCLLPFAFSICVVFYYRTFSYWKDSLALTIMFISLVVRYLITPFLMTLSSHIVSDFSPTASSFRIAIVISVFELFAILTVIDVFWTRYKKTVNQDDKNKPVTFKLKWTGLVFLALLVAMLVMRGHIGNVFAHYSTWWKESVTTDKLFTYDMTMVEVVKSVLVLIVVAFFSRKFHSCNTGLKWIYFVLAFVCAIANTLLYVSDQRTTLATLLLSSMIMLVSMIPEKKKMFAIVFAVIAVIVVGLAFIKINFGYKSGVGIASKWNVVARSSESAEAYVTGPTILAISNDTYSTVRDRMSFSTVYSDIIHGAGIFNTVPFLRGIYNTASNIPITNDLFVSALYGHPYICPNYTMCTYYFGKTFGWLMEIVIMLLWINAVILIDKVKSKNRDAGFYYALTYIEVLLGQVIFINNFYLFFHAFTNTPLWILIFALVNHLGTKIKIGKKSEVN